MSKYTKHQKEKLQALKKGYRLEHKEVPNIHLLMSSQGFIVFRTDTRAVVVSRLMIPTETLLIELKNFKITDKVEIINFVEYVKNQEPIH